MEMFVHLIKGHYIDLSDIHACVQAGAAGLQNGSEFGRLVVSHGVETTCVTAEPKGCPPWDICAIRDEPKRPMTEFVNDLETSLFRSTEST
jgi:hypothetical protein